MSGSNLDASGSPARSDGADLARLYLSLSDDWERPVETEFSVAQTLALLLAALALAVAAPLAWAGRAKAATAATGPVATKVNAAGDDEGAGAGGTPDDSTGVGQAASSAPGQAASSAPGQAASSAPGQAASSAPGQAASSAPGQATSSAPNPPVVNPPVVNPPVAPPPVVAPDVPPVPVMVVTPTPQIPQGAVAGAQPAPQTGPGAANVGQSGVAGAQVVNGTATLHGASGCAHQAFFARVNGRAIMRVTFTLDGRRIASVRGTGAGNIKVRVQPQSLRIGSHRLVARVQFRSPAGARTRLLALRFRRCARVASGPSFTG